MQVTIENEFLSASFSAKGAELQSLYHKPSGTERMWGGDPAFWGKYSPILFPIVGALKNDQYKLNGETYELPRHGFARDQAFEISAKTDDSITFTLQDDVESFKHYPFSFTLSVVYRLEGSRLSVKYVVENPGDQLLLFSIGAHPAFAINTADGINYADHYLEFERDNELKIWKIANNLISEQTEMIKLDNRRLKLTHELFYDDALVIKDLNSERIRLLNNRNVHGLAFEFKDFPYFGIWAAKNADFVCLEPWCGIADSESHNQYLEYKEGIVALREKERWERSWSVEIF